MDSGIRIILFAFCLDNALSFENSFSRIYHGFRCSSGIMSRKDFPAISMCAVKCNMETGCHAINYRRLNHTCEIINSHGNKMHILKDPHSSFITLNSSEVNIKAIADVKNQCRVGPVTWGFMNGTQVPSNEVVFVSNNTYLCRAEYGYALLPGAGYAGNQFCSFVFENTYNKVSRFRALYIENNSGFGIEWIDYDMGSDIPTTAFQGGHSSEGNPLYICRAMIGNKFYPGYFDPLFQETKIVYNEQVITTPDIQLLIINPNGPTFGTTAGDMNCPRWHVSTAYTHFEWTFPGFTTLPGVVSGGGPSNFVGLNTCDGQAIGKVLTWIGMFVYGESVVWCKLPGILRVIRADVSVEWISYIAGSSLPNNALPLAHSPENSPLYATRYMPHEGGAVGSYNAHTGIASHEYDGIRHEKSFDVLGSRYQTAVETKLWSDEGYENFNGPMTAIRVLHDASAVYGIQSRFGAQWSSGFWSSTESIDTIVQITLEDDEYIESVFVIMDEMLNGLVFHSNLRGYGPYGRQSGTRQLTLKTQCGQIKHFSGQAVWGNSLNKNISTMFAAHGQVCG